MLTESFYFTIQTLTAHYAILSNFQITKENIGQLF